MKQKHLRDFGPFDCRSEHAPPMKTCKMQARPGAVLAATVCLCEHPASDSTVPVTISFPQFVAQPTRQTDSAAEIVTALKSLVFRLAR